MRRVPASTIWHGLWIAAIAVRVVAVAVLVFGPWTDEPAELSGWDAERFQEIAGRRSDGWAELPIEYPPGSVLAIDALAADDVVSTNRILVIASALLELAAVVLLWRSVSPRAARAFLILGLPLVPMGLLRLDMLATVLATGAAVALIGRYRSAPARFGPTERASAETARAEIAPLRRLPAVWLADASFAVLVMAGAMVKIWPALVVAGALALGRRTAAVAALAATGVAGVAWLVMVGAGLEPIDQVFSLRGATGWHVESLPGAVVALFGDADARLELNAFRIGTIDRGVVTAGRGVAIAVIGLLTATGFRAGGTRPAAQRLALVMLGSVAALLVTAPLLSPQFLLWLTPWGALLFVDGNRSPQTGPTWSTAVVGLLATSLILTGVVLTVFGPANLAATGPALLLTIRNMTLGLLPIACYRELRAP